MKRLLLAALLLAGLAAHGQRVLQQSKCRLDIGEVVDKTCITVQDTTISLLVNPASIQPGFTFTYGGQHFSVVAKAGRYTFISADMAFAFRTPEGVHMGMTLAQLGITPASVTSIPGWATIYQLPSGWMCAFALDKPVTPASKVSYVFKTTESFYLRQNQIHAH